MNKELYQHSKEQEALKTVEDILFQKELEDYYCEYVEKARVPDLLGKTVKATPNQFKQVYNLIEEITRVLDMDPVPCYVYEDFYYGAEAKGIKMPWIELSSKTLKDFSQEELRFLLGKEICAIHLGYTRHYHIIDQYLEEMSGKLGSEILEKTSKASLYKWRRISHYTSDCFGLLMCGNISVAIKVILKTILNSSYLAEEVNIKEYIKQGEEINALQGKAYDFTKLDESVPYACFRIKHLLSYAASNRGSQALQKLGNYR